MRIDTMLRLLCLGFLAMGLSGCIQAGATATSNKANDYHPEIKRLLVLTDMGETLKHRADGDEEPVFEADVTDSLAKCGIAVNVHRRDPLALQNDEALAVRAFSPDTVLTLQWKTAQSGGRTPGTTVFASSLIDVATKKLVWKAQIDLKGGWSLAETLAASVIDRLKADTVVSSSCPTPVVPRRGI